MKGSSSRTKLKGSSGSSRRSLGTILGHEAHVYPIHHAYHVDFKAGEQVTLYEMSYKRAVKALILAFKKLHDAASPPGVDEGAGEDGQERGELHETLVAAAAEASAALDPSRIGALSAFSPQSIDQIRCQVYIGVMSDNQTTGH